ncbi:MAG: nucleotidyltransferase family protein [Syntrophomonas sp.]
MEISAVILAAGYASRMGRLKALLPLEGETLLQRAVRIFKIAGVTDIVVVTGYEHEKIQASLADSIVRIVFNPFFDQEMLVSVKTGAASLNSQAEAFYVLPVDTPLQSADILLQMNKVMAEAGPGIIVHPCYQGRRGHPPLIGTAYINALLQWNGSGGLKAFLHDYRDQAFDVDFWDPYILYDIDTPEEYRCLKEDLRSNATIPLILENEGTSFRNC